MKDDRDQAPTTTPQRISARLCLGPFGGGCRTFHPPDSCARTNCARQNSRSGASSARTRRAPPSPHKLKAQPCPARVSKQSSARMGRRGAGRSSCPASYHDATNPFPLPIIALRCRSSQIAARNCPASGSSGTDKPAATSKVTVMLRSARPCQPLSCRSGLAERGPSIARMPADGLQDANARRRSMARKRHQRRYGNAVCPQRRRTTQVGQVDRETRLLDRRPRLAQQPYRRTRGAAGCDQVVD